MKSYTLFIVLALLFNSCKEATNKTSEAEPETKEVAIQEAIKKSTPKSNGTYLCKINGIDWAYSKASGIVSRHKKTNKREAIFTFTKKLDKGSETVQLFYDGDGNDLEQVNIHLKVPKKDGERMTAMYIYHPNTGKFHPNAKISGTIDLSNASSASGNAEITDLSIRFDEGNLQNKSDNSITVEGINFKGIGYSEAGKLFGSKSK
jgi:hypothetical protein